MNLKMPITKDKVKTHFHYHFWKYILLVALSVLLWNLLFTTTHYRTPEALKIEFYTEGYQTSQTEENMNALLSKIHTDVMPEMEEVSNTVLTLDDTYGDMQLTVWATAGQGDVYVLQKDRFLRLAQGGAMLDLQPYVDNGMLNVDGIDLTAGMVRDEETGAKVLRGIPAATLSHLDMCGVMTQDAMLSVLTISGNEEYAIRFLNYLLTHMREDSENPL